MEDSDIKDAIRKLKPLDEKIEAMKTHFDKKPEEYKRPSWNEYFLEIAKLVGSRGTCDRGRNGAVIVKNKRIITTGYVGAPMGLPHCDESGHLMSDVVNPDGSISKHCIRTIHAEQNAIIQAALHGISTEGSTLYAKFEPCFTCAKMIINAGIKRVVCQKKYHAAELTRKFFKEAGVDIVYMEDKVEDYPNQ
jgi:dCMP deaminase